MIFLGGSILAMIITNSIYSFQSLLGTYSSGGILDLGWIASALLAGQAGLAGMVVFRSTPKTNNIAWIETFDRSLKPIGQFLPYDG